MKDIFLEKVQPMSPRPPDCERHSFIHLSDNRQNFIRYAVIFTFLEKKFCKNMTYIVTYVKNVFIYISAH